MTTPEQTLREKFGTKFNIAYVHDKGFAFLGVEIVDFFLAQFDEMLAEDIEKMDKRRSERNGVQMGLNEAVSILEARREALKK